MSFSIIAALAKNRVIGKHNQLPWSIAEDLAYFYQTVFQKPVVMGHHTYTSLGKPIAHSPNIVLSRDLTLSLPEVKVMHSVEEVVQFERAYPQEVMIIGGAEVYQQFIPLADKMYLTLIDEEINGDSYFPKWPKQEWLEISTKTSQNHRYGYRFVILVRVKTYDYPRSGL